MDTAAGRERPTEHSGTHTFRHTHTEALSRAYTWLRVWIAIRLASSMRQRETFARSYQHIHTCIGSYELAHRHTHTNAHVHTRTRTDIHTRPRMHLIKIF